MYLGGVNVLIVLIVNAEPCGRSGVYLYFFVCYCLILVCVEVYRYWGYCFRSLPACKPGLSFWSSWNMSPNVPRK